MIRTYGTILTEQRANQPSEVNNNIKTYTIDPAIYKKTGKLVKVGGEEIVPTIDQLTAGKRLKEEITTIEQLEAIGNISTVAKRYGVSTGTAHGLKMHLVAKRDGIKREQSSRSKAQIMRDELSTLEKFESAGSYREIATKYSIGKTAANDWHRKLREEVRKMEQPTAYEIEKLHTDVERVELPKVELDKSIKISFQSVQCDREDVRNESEGDCPKEDKRGSESAMSETEEKPICIGAHLENGVLIKDDLQGLVEPESPWTMPSYEEIKNDEKFNKFFDNIIEEIKKPVTDEQIWGGIEDDLKELRERAHKKADGEIRDKFLGLMGCNE